jgi:hypothetical protein
VHTLFFLSNSSLEKKTNKLTNEQTQGTARQGTARQGTARQGTARHGKARQGTARHGKARQGTERHGKARHGKAHPFSFFPTPLWKERNKQTNKHSWHGEEGKRVRSFFCARG